jgi:two-component system chemotaxis response regulator CheY
MKKTALVVDDSSFIRKIAKQILDGMGFEVTEAKDGAQALERCQEQLPDFILLDWNMPVMSGLEFLNKLRKMPKGNEPRVVFCTTENTREKILVALEAGATEYIMKPFDQEIIRTKLEQIGMV